MEMVKAVGLKRYYDTEENEVRALDDVSLSKKENFLPLWELRGAGKRRFLICWVAWIFRRRAAYGLKVKAFGI